MKTLLLALISFLAVTCGSDPVDPPSVEKNLVVSKNAISAECTKTTETVSVTANCDWGVYSSDRQWCTVSPSGGVSGTSSVNVEIAENSSYEDRSAELVFSYGTLSKSVKVTQKGAEKPAVDTSIKAPDGYALVWHDEFDQEPLESGNWKFESWDPGRVNHELQRYVAGGKKGNQKTAFVEDGVLHIVAQKCENEVISARMNSTENWTYGWFEARIQLPKGKGTWPAFWMMPKDQSLGWPACGEIDILEEVGVNPNKTSSSIHTKSYNHTINTQKTKEVLTANAESEFHVYAMEWTPDAIKSYVDGKQFFTFANDGKGNNDTWPFNKAFFLILNLAWGGDWGGMSGVDETALPCTMLVDYVRVFQKTK